MDKTKNELGKTYTYADKLKAAYALNMCTVSVSQIVEYNDSYILEQEYEAILNNLNLEEIPKDEALLNILTELLNVITFFRIQGIRKDMIEKKYKQRMKSAIWSAVPKMSMIVAGSPASIAFSLATQIGIGYMNYRKEKAQIVNEKENENIELQITAIEQLNALRRELFTTAWRLADEYNFPDRYRLTERQIKQYNEILMDQNYIRKYERLESIKDKFEAYIPFWYHLGHTASYISGDSDIMPDVGVREYYKHKAIEHFERFYKLYTENKLNILREDQMISSYALEYSDLLLLENTEKDSNDEERKRLYLKVDKLLELAEEMSGNANDILQLCAIGYLKTGNSKSAARLLRVLVNEGYNDIANAKLLSRLYVTSYINENNAEARVNYNILKERIGEAVLFPMPEGKTDDIELQNRYLEEQKFLILSRYREVYMSLIRKYIFKFNQVIPLPEVKEDRIRDYYADTAKSKAVRMAEVERILNSSNREAYLEWLSASSFRTKYIDIINDVLHSLDQLSIFRECIDKEGMVLSIRGQLILLASRFKEVQNKMMDGDFTAKDYKRINDEASFIKIMGEFFEQLKEYTSEEIEKVNNFEKLDYLESELVDLCEIENIEVPMLNNIEVRAARNKNEITYFDYDILGSSMKSEKEERRMREEVENVIKKEAEKFIYDKSGNVRVILKGTEEFDSYFKNERLSEGRLKEVSIVVIDDTTRKDKDLIFTYAGFMIVEKNGIVSECEYSEVKYVSQAGFKELSTQSGFSYSNKSVDIEKMYSAIEKVRDTIKKGV